MGTRSTYPPAWTDAARAARLPVLPPLSAGTADSGQRKDDAYLSLGDNELGVPWLVDLAHETPPRRTGVHRAVAARERTLCAAVADEAEAPSQRTERPEAIGLPSSARPVRVTERLIALGKVRPVVQIGAACTTFDEPHVRRSVKLPPIWLLANILVLLVAAIAVVPRIAPVDAASACDWHTVVPGDTLGNLGYAHHTNALALASANHIQNPNLIFVGQRLCIPMASWAQAASAPQVPAVAHPPSFGSATNVQSFVTLALPYARSAHQQTGWPVSLILAQWGLEHGWHIPSYTGYNWGNSGAIPGMPTVNGLNVPGSPSAFAYAATPQDGLTIYLHCAHLAYYQAVAPAAANGADAAAQALGRSPWDAGHYTDQGNPGSSLINMMRVYNLYWYDTH